MSQLRALIIGLIVLLGLALVGLPVLLFTVIMGGTSEPQPSCTPPGGEPGIVMAGLGQVGLSPTQLGNAAAVVAEGQRLGVPRQGLIVALAVAHQESKFWNYANDGEGGDLTLPQLSIASSLGLPHDQVGTDHGSLGVFQQQWPWWGTMRQLMTPSTAAGKFYQALLRVPGWESLPVTVAGQAVQRSAYPDAYADDVELAVTLLDHAQPHGNASERAAGVQDAFYDASRAAGQAEDLAGGVGCADFTLCPATGLPVENGLTPDAVLVVRCVVAEFGVTDLGGVGGRPDNATSLHPSGRAVDVMIPGWDTPTGVALGDRVATWARTYAVRMGVTEVIWRGQIWTTARNAEGWRAYLHPTGATDPTRAHHNHVHISVAGNAAVQPQFTVPAGAVTYPLPNDTAYTDRANWGRSGRSWASGHTGTDLSAPCGTPVLAAHGGRVLIDTPARWAGRWLVKVSTGTGRLTTWYAHMESVSVRAGDLVQPGQQLGQVGALGNATGCHLHFEVHPYGGTIYADNINPSRWLAANVGRSPPGGAMPVHVDGGDPGWGPGWDTGTGTGGGRGTVTAVSYNIRFGQRGLAGVARDLRASGADIVALQEVDRRPRAGVDQARWLATRLGMHAYYGPNASWPGKQRGNAILSRYPLTATNLRLPRTGATEPRGLIWARVNVGGTVLTVYATHLHFGGASRAIQARAVAAKVGAPGCGTILMGDLNSSPHTQMYAAVTRQLVDPFATGRYGPGRTAPVARPKARIDYVLHSRHLSVRHATVLPAGASDHRGVKVVLTVQPQTSCAA